MSPHAHRILLIDPLTLLGREITALLEGTANLGWTITPRHTNDDDEAVIADIRGEATVVPRLDDLDDLLDHDVAVVASDRDTAALASLAELVTAQPTMCLVDAARRPMLAPSTVATLGTAHDLDAHRLVRLAHPAVIAAELVLAAMEELAPRSVAIHAIEPVSAWGGHAIDTLAQQAIQRLRGEQPTDRIAGHVVAFSHVAVASDELSGEARRLLPGFQAVATRTLGGGFHGYLTQLTIALDEAASVSEIVDCWRATDTLEPVDTDLDVMSVAEADRVAVATPSVSDDGRLVAIVAACDGLRIGGATTLLKMLEAWRG